jgi:hypothetical protein
MNSNKEKTLEIFKKCREKPKSPFEESDFLNGISGMHTFLFGHPFRCSKYNKFIRKIELEFNICFADENLKKLYPLDEFLTLIEKLQKNKAISIEAVQKNIAKKPNYSTDKAIAFAGVLCSFNAFLFDVDTVFTPSFFIIILGIRFLLKIKNKNYYTNLLKKIQAV